MSESTASFSEEERKEIEVDEKKMDEFDAQANEEQDGAEEEEEEEEEVDGEMVKVFLRLRPHAKKNSSEMEFGKASDDALVVLDDSTVETIAPEESQSFKNRETGGKYKFSKVFNKSTSQEELFRSTTENLVDTVFKGKDGLLFAYGVTNAGKTYTVEGSEKDPGIIPRALRLVFDNISAQAGNNQGDGAKATVDVSYLQVYNEQVHDLQAMSARPGSVLKDKLKIKLRDDGVEVEGLKATSIETAEEGLEILAKGREVRETHETQCNLQSSRSHSVFIIQVDKHDGSKPSKLYIVDLAGSERTKRTMTSRARQREASNINCSLMNLMRCLDTLRLNQKNKRQNKREIMVPFRQSKLTLLFRDCFVGSNCGGVAMIINASARPEDYDETAHALKYGAIVKNVKVARMATRRPSVVAQYGFDGRKIKRSESNEEKSTEGKRKPPIPTSSAYLDVDGEISVEDHPIISALLYELADARMRCVTMEAEIREEVAAEMAQRLEEMETTFKKRVDAAKQISENKSEMLLQNIRKRVKEGGKNSLYTVEDIEALVQNIKECEEEMERMRQLHTADTEILQRELEQLRSTTNKAESEEDAKQKRRQSAEAHRQSFERLDRLVVEKLDHAQRYKEELAEERALHEKTIKQLESATQLAKDAQVGEAEAERKLYALHLENQSLKKKLGISSKRDSGSSTSSLMQKISSPRLPLRVGLVRKSKAKKEMAEGQSSENTSKLSNDIRILRNHSSAPASDETWTAGKEYDSDASFQTCDQDTSKDSSFKSDSSFKLGLVSRMVGKMRSSYR